MVRKGQVWRALRTRAAVSSMVGHPSINGALLRGDTPGHDDAALLCAGSQMASGENDQGQKMGWPYRSPDSTLSPFQAVFSVAEAKYAIHPERDLSHRA